jgi:hypothetical protein
LFSAQRARGIRDALSADIILPKFGSTSYVVIDPVRIAECGIDVPIGEAKVLLRVFIAYATRTN